VLSSASKGVVHDGTCTYKEPIATLHPGDANKKLWKWIGGVGRAGVGCRLNPFRYSDYYEYR